MSAASKLNEKRCNGCRKVLAKANIINGTVEIICPKCGTVNKWQATHPAPEHNRSESQTFAIRMLPESTR